MLANGAAAGLSMPAGAGMASRELADPGGLELKRVVDELRRRPVAGGRARRTSAPGCPRARSSVLMTTIAIQQRAGGDTVRALSELATTLDARKDLRREVTTLLSGVVFTSYVVAGHRRRHDPAAQRDVAGRDQGDDELVRSGSLGIAIAGTLWTIAFVLIRRTTQDRRLMRPCSSAPLAALFLALGLAAIPMLRDAGPVERLGGRIGGVREAAERTSITAKLVEALAARLGPRLAPSLRAKPARGARAQARLRRPPGRADRPALHRAARPRSRCCWASAAAALMLLIGASPIWMPMLGARRLVRARPSCSTRAGRLRQQAIERTLPDFLDILAVSVRAGLGYRYALRRVAESLGGPVGEEMFVVLRQIDLGADRREAFLALRDRNESDALKAFVAAQLQAEELGVPLSEALNDIASDMRRMASQTRPPRGAAREPARQPAGHHPDRPGLDDPDPALDLLQRDQLRRGSQPLWRIGRPYGSRDAAPTAPAAGWRAPAA